MKRSFTLIVVCSIFLASMAHAWDKEDKEMIYSRTGTVGVEYNKVDPPKSTPPPINPDWCPPSG